MKKIMKGLLKTAISLILLIAISLTGSYVVNTYAAQRTVVDGHSMDDNFYDGENIIANKIIYNFQKPKRFDVVTIYPYGHKHKEDIVEYTQRLVNQLKVNRIINLLKVILLIENLSLIYSKKKNLMLLLTLLPNHM